MYYVTERNERKSRNHAIFLAISLHLALGAVLYLQASDTHPKTTNTQAQIQKNTPQTTPAQKADLP